MEEKSISCNEIVNVIRSMEKKDEQFYFFLRSCENSNLKLCQACLDAGIDINIREHFYEQTILEVFCESEKFNIEIAKWLLDNGAYPNKTKSSFGPLTRLCQNGNLEGAKLLYERGALIKSYKETDEESDLCWAVSKGNYQIVKWLIELGVDLEYDIDVEAYNPFYNAIINQRSDIVGLFLKSGVPNNFYFNDEYEDNDNCSTPLHIAVDNKDIKTATILLKQGTDPNANRRGISIFGENDNIAITPMDIAIVNEDSDMQKTLSEFGGTTSTKDEKIKAIYEVDTSGCDINIKAVMKKIMQY